MTPKQIDDIMESLKGIEIISDSMEQYKNSQDKNHKEVLKKLSEIREKVDRLESNLP